MASSSDRLTPLQRQVLRGFFELESGYFLTGGAALAGYYLGHRETRDLDLFTDSSAAFEQGERTLGEVAARLGARVEVRQRAPGFLRMVLEKDGDGVVVDLVLDRVPQLCPTKTVQDGVRIDPIEEILANKLTALLGRAEERDLVDLFCLERAGYRLEDALAGAARKDGGFTPAALAWVLSQIRLPGDRQLPGGLAPEVVRPYLDELIRRLRRLAMPEPGPRPGP